MVDTNIHNFVSYTVFLFIDVGVNKKYESAWLWASVGLKFFFWGKAVEQIENGCGLSPQACV